MSYSTIKLLSREDTGIKITSGDWQLLEEIFMGGTLCDSLMFDINSFDSDWDQLKEQDPALFEIIKKLCEAAADGHVEISIDL